MATPVQIFDQLGLWKWWLSVPTNLFNGSTEKGIDYASAYGTPIGAIQGGQVIQVQPHNNSIGDVVVVAGHSGYWVYQHVTASVHVGQVIGTGTVIGTQNGLPTDQYSTGSHIEVRFAPSWQQGIDPWNQSYINPQGTFNAVGNQVSNDALPPVGSGSSQVVSQSGDTSLSQGPAWYDIPGQVQQGVNSVINPVVTSAESGITKVIDIGMLVTVAIVAIGFGFFLLMPKQNIGASNSNMQTASNVAKLAAE